MSERIKEIYKGMMLNNAIGICLDGSSWHGWLFAKHPNGQWVSLCKIDMWQARPSRIRAVGGDAGLKYSNRTFNKGLVGVFPYLS